MSIEEPTPLTRERLLQFFLDSCKPRADRLVGMEMEKLCRSAATGEAIPYDGDGPCVRGLLERLRDRLGGNPVYEGDHLIGLDGAWGTVSLEPGGQVEWSSRPVTKLATLERDLSSFLEAFERCASAIGVRLLDVAVDPVHPVEAMHWMPKARYKIMRPYMGARGRLAHRMMTQTASIQCAFDYSSARDWVRKFRAGVLFAPLTVAMFANSSRIDGKESGYRSFRQAIWRETEPDRCGIPGVVFEPGFGLEAWVDWVCEVPSMFRHRGRGLVPAGGVPFRELLALTGCDALSAGDWELHLSSIFTEVRSYSYIEVRSADLQPDRRMIAVPTFWTGILYHEDSLEQAIELGGAWDSHDRWLQAMDSAARDGMEGSAGGRPLRELSVRALEIAASGLRGGAVQSDDGDDLLRPLVDLAAHLGIEPGW